MAALLCRRLHASVCLSTLFRYITGTSPWEVLDYGDVVVHVFTPEQREYYALDDFYSAAEEVEWQQAQGQPAAPAEPKWST